MIYDYCIIGGGIVGLATALELMRAEPNASLIVVEKEASVARHQTGHNSGVIHSGLYYKPGSLKADLCRTGMADMKEFCRANDIPFRTPGKLVVATTQVELERMGALYLNAVANEIPVERIDAETLRTLEPNIAGRGALRITQTAIVDYIRVCEVMARMLQKAGAELVFGSAVHSIREEPNRLLVETQTRSITALQLVACAGLQADRIAALAGVNLKHRIVPFRGEYYEVKRPGAADLIRHMIYPVPDPTLPFLGIHLTPTIDGRLTVGPNAVLALSRELYRKSAVTPRDVLSTVTYPGFWKMAGRNLGSGLGEMLSSLSKSRYLGQCRKYCPSLALKDLSPYPAGIRAQAVGHDGTLVHDFLFERTARSLHVVNAPSPAATSSIPIGRVVSRLLREAAPSRTKPTSVSRTFGSNQGISG